MLLLWMWFTPANALDYQAAPAAIREVLDAPELPLVTPSPDGKWLLVLTPVRLPPIADRAAPMHALAGERLDARTGGFHVPFRAVSPRLVRVEDGASVELEIPDPVTQWSWSDDAGRLAFTTLTADHLGLWIADTSGRASVLPDLAVAPVLGSSVQWLHGEAKLLVKRVPAARGAPPPPPVAPSGPIVRDAAGETASSTYEARDLLVTAHDDALFTWFATSELVVVDTKRGRVEPVGAPGLYADVGESPDGRHLLVEQLVPPWSHRVTWQKFAHSYEVWTLDGTKTHTIADLPAAELIPIHGVATGPRAMQWRSTAPATLIWLEALDGGDPVKEASVRDRIVARAAPFDGPDQTVLDTPHRVTRLAYGDDGLLVIDQFERERRWRHVWTANVDVGPSSAKPWFDLSTNDGYADPGSPMETRRKDGTTALLQDEDLLFFRGEGASPTGDRPFLDRRSLTTGRVERLFRSDPKRFERVLWANTKGEMLVHREAPDQVPNIHFATLGAALRSPSQGEAAFASLDRPVTSFVDPTPALRRISRRIVTYTRADGVPLSFTLVLPPDYAGGALPTVLAAYPREFSDAATAGQVSGAETTFLRFGGASFLYYALQGYAVLLNTTMPVLGDPETAYDTFAEQLVTSAAAAVDKAVELGVTDRDRVGVIGHSHGGLMVATLLAHSDVFRAGIARSGAYNHTIRPFGFQSERRTLWEASETYLHLSPVMFAPQINEPLLLIHGAVDQNPGTVPLQSERLFEAIRGVGGTTRLLLLPHEGHSYDARESVEHTLWEQATWMDRYVKNAPSRAAEVSPAP